MKVGCCMLTWRKVPVAGGLLLIVGMLLAGCGGPAPIRPAQAPTLPVAAPTLPVAITPAPGDVWWVLEAGLGAETALDGTLQSGQTVYVLAGFEAGLSPTSPTASSRQVVFALACDDSAGAAPRWWLEPDPDHVAGCGESLAWTLSYEATRIRLGLSLDAAAEALTYHLTATAHSPY